MTQLPYETPRPPSPNRWLWWVAAGVLVVAILGAALTVSRDEQPAAPAAPSSEPAIATQPSPVLPSPQAAPAPTTPPQPALPIPTGIVPTEVLVDFPMPDLVGLDLQTAQDTVQANGVFLSRSHDLLGDRRQVLDANWVVCDQNIAAGERVTGVAEGRIDLGVVRTGERCP
jgi:hypothetical protein